MQIEDFLTLAATTLDVHASDKKLLLEKLAGLVAKHLGLSTERLASELLKREELGSTGMGGGVAIPHARFAEVKRPFGVLARLKRPIEFDSIDGLQVDIVFLVVLPTSPDGEQLNALACAARKLRDLGTLAELRRASDAAGLFRAIAAKEVARS